MEDNTNLPGNKSLDELYKENRALNKQPLTSEDLDFLFKPINQDSTKETILPSFGDPVEDYWKAENQSVPELVGKGLANTATDMFFTTLEGAGYLADLPGIWNSVTQSEQEFGNWFSDLMKEAKEETKFDIHRTAFSNKMGGFNPLALSWWADNAPSIGSAVSLMLPAMGITKMLSSVGKSLGAFNMVNKASKALKVPASVLSDSIKGLTMASTSRIMENTMEASESYNQLFSKLNSENEQHFLETGVYKYTEEEIKQMSAEAAQSTWNLNSAMLLTDMFQYGKLLKGFKASRALNKESVLQNMATEGFEEGYQYIASQEAQRNAQKIEDGTSFAGRLADYTTSGEFLTSVTMGALGGGVFAAAGNKLQSISLSSNEQTRASVMGDRKKFYDMQDKAFMDLAVDHIIKGNAAKLESELKTIGESSDEDIIGLESNPDNFRSKVKKHLDDLAFAEETWNEISLNKDKFNKPLGQVELRARIDQRKKENRIKELDSQIHSDLVNSRVSLSLTPELAEIKELKLHVDALSKVPQLKALHDEYKAKLKTAIDSLEGVSKQDIFNKIKYSNDNVTVNNLKDKYTLETELATIKNIVSKTETEEGQKELTNQIDEVTKNKKLTVFKNRIEQDDFTEEKLDKLSKDANLKNDPLFEEYSKLIVNRKKELSEAKDKEKKDKELNIVNTNSPEEAIEIITEERSSEPPTVDETVIDSESLVVDSPISNLQFKKADIERRRQEELTSADKISGLDNLVGGINNDISNAPKQTWRQYINAKYDAELAELEDKTEIKEEVTSDIEIIEEQLREEDYNPLPEPTEDIVSSGTFEKQQYEANELKTNKGEFKVAYNDKQDPSMWWLSVYGNLPVGTEVTFEYVVDDDLFNKSVQGKVVKNFNNKNDIEEFTNANKHLVYPVRIIANGKFIGYLPAIYTKTEFSINNDIARFRKKLSEGFKYKAKISRRGPGWFNNANGKNTSDNKTETLDETLGTKNGDFVLGYGIDGNVQVPNNQDINNSVASPNATLGAMYVILQAPDGSYKNARCFLRNLNQQEIDYVLKTIDEYDGNIDELKRKVNEVTYVGSNRKGNNKHDTLHLRLNKNFIEFYDDSVGTIVRYNYDNFPKYELVKLLNTKKRNIVQYNLNKKEEYIDEVTGKVYENGYNHFLSENLIVTTDLVVNFPFRQSSIYFNNVEEISKDNNNQEQTKPVSEDKKSTGKNRVPQKRNITRRGLIDKSFKTWNEKQELEWLSKKLPVSAEVVNDLRTIYSKAGNDAYGLFHNSMIYVMKNAPEGIVYHEAFHAVFNLFLTPSQKDNVLKQAKTKYKKPSKKELQTLKENYSENEISDSELLEIYYEERLAEDFRKYVLSQKSNSFIGAILDFFKRLYQLTKVLLNIDSLTINELFYRTNQGVYKQADTIYKNTFKAPKFYLHPSFTIKEQQEAIESINYIFFDELEKIAQQISTQQGRNVQYDELLTTYKLPVDVIYDNVLNSLEERLEDNSNLQLIIDNFDDNNINGIDIEGLKNKHIKYLNNYGFNLKTRKLDNAEEREDYEKVFEVSEENSQKESWQYHYLEVSGRDKLSSRMKRFIGLTREATKEYVVESDIYEPKYNMFGEFKLVNLNETYNYLMRNLSGINNFSEMLDRLFELVEYNPSLYQIYQELADSSPEFQSEFFVNFSKSEHKFLTVVYEEEVDEETNDVLGVKYKIIDSNRRTLGKSIFSDWESNFKRRLITYDKNKEVLNTSKIDTIKTKFDTFKNKLIKTNDLSENLISELLDILDDIGLKLDREVLEKYTKNITVGNREVKGIVTFKNLVFGKDSKSIENLVDKLNKGVNIFSNEQASIEELVKLNVNYKKDFIEANFKNVENKSIYSYNNNSYIHKLFNDLKGSNYKSVIEGLNTTFNSSSRWLNKLLTDENFRENFDIFTLDGLREQGEIGVGFADMTTQQSLITKINMYLNGGRKYGYYTMATPADKPLLNFIKADRIDYKQAVDKVLTTVIIPEFNRIKKVHKQVDNVISLKKEWESIDSSNKAEKNKAELKYKNAEDKLVKNYHFQKETDKLKKDGNGFKMQYIPVEELNDFALKDINVNNSELRTIVKNWLNKEVLSLKETLLREEIIKIGEDGVLYNNLLDNEGIDSIKVGDKENQTMSAIASYYINSLLAQAEMTRIGIGDLAFYKKDPESNTTIVDAAKRTPEITAPGEDLNSEIKDKFSLVILKTEKIDTELYKGVDETDAQGYCTLDRYIDLLKMGGLYNDKIEAALEQLREGVETNDNLSIILNPVKGFYFGHVNNIPTQVKYSTLPLIPALTKNHPKLDKLRLTMEKQKVDEVVFDSAVKVGQRTSLTFDDFTTRSKFREGEFYNLNNKDWRRQQNIPEHHLDSENLYGSQIRRLILANINDATIYKISGKDGVDIEFTGSEIKKMFHEGVSRNVEINLSETIKRFNNDESVRKLLTDEINKRNLGDQYLKALEPINGQLVIPPTMTKKFEAILMSIFKNNVMRPKIKGITAVQVSKFGFNDLSFVKNENGVVTEAECYLPWWSKEFFPADENGNIDISKVDPRILNIIGYRIPTEGKYSMIPLKVKGFLPKESGSIVVLPSEITSQMGSDFDIDKLYIMLPEFDSEGNKLNYFGTLDNIKNNTVEQNNNLLLDITRSVLLNEAHFSEMTKPGGFEELKEIAEFVKKYDNNNSRSSYISPNTQEYIRQINQAGAQLIGLGANHNTNHVLAVNSGLMFMKDSASFKDDEGEKITRRSLNKELNIYGSLISEDLAQFLAAFVDNAKDPIASYLNINMETFGTVAMLVRLGFGLKTPIYFISQPILKEYIKASKKQRKLIVDKYLKKIENSTYKYKPEVVYSFKQSELKRNIQTKDRNTMFYVRQLQVLSTYLAYEKMGGLLSKVVSATRADALGLNPTLTGNRRYLTNVGEAINLEEAEFPIMTGISSALLDNSFPLIKAFTDVIPIANKKVGKYIPWDTEAFRAIRETIELKTEKEDEDFNYQAMTYLMSDLQYLNDNFNRKSDIINNLPSKLLTFKDKYPDNHFLRLLSVTETNKIKFNAPSDKSTTERDMIIYDWYDLLISDNNEDKQLAEDLALYSLFTTGLVKKIDSYFDYIPIDYLDSIGYREHYLNKLSNLTDYDYLSGFRSQFLRNISNIKYLKLLREDDIKVENKDFLITENYVKEPVILHNGDFWGLQESYEQGGLYSRVSKLGTLNTVEYSFNSDLNKSVEPSNNVLIDEKNRLFLADYLPTDLEIPENNTIFAEGSIEQLFNDNVDILKKSNPDITLEQLIEMEKEFGREFVIEYIKNCKGI